MWFEQPSTTIAITVRMQSEPIKKLAGLIHDIPIAMLTTENDDGTLHSRPMATQKTEFDGHLWFFSRESAPKSGEIKSHQQVNLVYSSPSHQRYVSVQGQAEIVKDQEKIRELWNPAYQAWFPGGVDDPEISLIRVHVESAQYWDTPSSRVVHLVGFVKGLVTGKPAKDIGENEKIRIA
jgi:general stress protein 26